MVLQEHNINLVPVLPEDEEFLFAVYAGTRTEEIDLWGWNAQEAEELLRMQYRFQTKSYHARYPRADSCLILLGEQRAGRLMAARTEHEIVLMDISLLPEFRNRGTGTAIIQTLQEEAAAILKPLVLSVLACNPARGLYERLGFVVIQQSDSYLRMEWKPPGLKCQGDNGITT